MRYWTKLTTEVSTDGIPAGWPIEKITANDNQTESPGPEYVLLEELEIKGLEDPHRDTVRAIAVTAADEKWAELRAKSAIRKYIDPTKGRLYLDEHDGLKFETE